MQYISLGISLDPSLGAPEVGADSDIQGARPSEKFLLLVFGDLLAPPALRGASVA